MKSLTCKKTLRLFAVSESPNETNGLYELEPFDDASFNQPFNEDDVNENLGELFDHLYGSGTYFEITDDVCDSNGNLYIEIDDDTTLDLNDLRGQINVDPEKATYHILIDGQYSEYCWVVAEMQGYIYTDSD